MHGWWDGIRSEHAKLGPFELVQRLCKRTKFPAVRCMSTCCDLWRNFRREGVDRPMSRDIYRVFSDENQFVSQWRRKPALRRPGGVTKRDEWDVQSKTQSENVRRREHPRPSCTAVMQKSGPGGGWKSSYIVRQGKPPALPRAGEK